jgi:F0F1-type ATP synthase membrane subunit c/vacuolar-type H+-ATPase subunit K
MPAMTKDPGQPRPLQLLLRAKAESDRRNYGAKNEILRRLLLANPSRFMIDSDDGRIIGLTHPSTGFRIHMPASAVPDGVELQRMAKVACDWDVTGALASLVDEAGDKVLALKEAAGALTPARDGYTVWYSPDHDELRLHCSAEDAGRLSGELLKYASVEFTPDASPLERFVEAWCLVKRSYSPAVRGVTDALALTPGPANAFYGGPRPLAATLLGGLAGAGVGYTAGLVGENLAGGYLDRGRLRRTLALLGAGVGATPGAAWGLYNTAKLGPTGFFSKFPHAGPDADQTPEAPPAEHVYGREVKASFDPENYFEKSAAGFSSGGGLTEPISVNSFNEVVWSPNDQFTPPALRAAVVGLMESASLSRGGSDLITPADIVRIGVGMGSGYAAGTLAGSTLGALAGLPAPAQEALQRAGTWAGALKAVVPSLFGG